MRRLCPVLVVGLVVSGCGGGGGDGGNGPSMITSVVINGDSTVVLAGTRQLTASALSGATPVTTGVTFQWSSTDTTKATVSAAGLVSGVRLGTAGITALAVLSGTPTSVSSTRNIRTRIGSIAITPSAPAFASLGDSVLANAEARNALNTPISGVTFTWISRAPGVATVTPRANNAQADAVAVANGTARIVITADGVSDSITAIVQQVATSLSISPDTTTLIRIGATVTPTVTATDARGNSIPSSAIGWNSLNAAAATVNPTSGVITSVNEGSARVIGTSGALSDTIRVGVALVYRSVDIATGTPPTPIDSGVITRLNGTLQLGVIVRDSGNTIVPSPQGITWSLKNSGSVGTIGSTSGIVIGNANTGRDTVVVVARTVRDSISLIVRQDVASVHVTPTLPLNLNFVGDTAQFAAEARDAGQSPIPGKVFAWSTNNPVLSIDANGLATAVVATGGGPGELVRVRASTDGITDSSVVVRVSQVAKAGIVNPSSLTFASLGRQNMTTCVVRDSADVTIPGYACVWSALTGGVVSVSPSGNGTNATITAIGNGTTTIRAEWLPDSFAISSVSVDQVAATVALLPANFGTPDVQMISSQSAPFYAVVRDSMNNIDTRERTDVTWSIVSGTSASVSPSTSSAATVTTSATAGSATVQAAIGAMLGQRVVSVVTTGVSFATNVQPIFSGSCIGCHSGPGAPEGMSLAANVSYNNIVDQASAQVPSLRRVRSFRPDSSYLVHKIQGTQGSVGGGGQRMPFGCSGASCLSNATINTIRNWILQGAQNN